MNTEQLQCFFKAAELKSFTKAAEALFLSQPALSKRINALEQELGLLLFYRNKSAVTELTPPGRVIYEGFLRLEKEREDVLSEARKTLKGEAGQLRVGIYESQVMDDKLREILNCFSETYPEIELVVTTNSFNGLYEELMEGTLDCAVTLGYDAVRRKGLEKIRLYEIPVCLVVPNPFLEQLSATESLKDFSELPFLTIAKENNLFQDETLLADAAKAGFIPKMVQAKDEKNFLMMLELGKGVAPLHIYHKCCSSPNATCFQLPELGPSDQYLVWNPKKSNPSLLLLTHSLEK